VIGGNNGVAIRKFKQYLHKCFHMKDLGCLGTYWELMLPDHPLGSSSASENTLWTSSLK